MSFLTFLWTAVFMAIGGLALLPNDLKPKEPIEQQGKFHPVAQQQIYITSGYKPTKAPSDSAWASQPPDTAWDAAGREWHQAELAYDSTKASDALADSLAYKARADSISLGLVDPRTFTWQEWEYQRQKAMYFYRTHNRKALRKKHLDELNGHSPEPKRWAEKSN